MTLVNIYLTFNGNCREAFEFYSKVFNKEFTNISTFGEMPSQEGFEIPESEKDKIMHVSLPFSSETALMGSDTGGHSGNVTIGNNFSVSVRPENKAEADRIFHALSQDGNVVMQMTDTFWNAYFGMVTDKFGINWMINFENPHS